MWRVVRPSGIVDINCFSALTLGFFDVATAYGMTELYAHAFQCPNAGLLRCGPSSCRVCRRIRRFSALTLGFFDVAMTAHTVSMETQTFQCPNAGLLRCGHQRSITRRSVWPVSVP